MTTWADMARENATAANRLVRDELPRSGASRAYFAAYCGATAALASMGHTKLSPLGNPSHAKLPQLVMDHLHTVPVHRRRKLASNIRELYRRRVAADYAPHMSVDRVFAHDAIREMNSVRFLLKEVR